jgi:hypothetical protein
MKGKLVWYFLGFMFLAQSCGPPLCPLRPTEPGGSGCNVRMQHYHSGELYRGQPWYKKQHLRYGEKYKDKRKPKKRQPMFKKKKNKTNKVFNPK